MTNLITDFLINNNLILEDEKEIYAYGLFVMGFNLTLVALILFIGFLLNENTFTIKYLFFWTPFRIGMGGSHCKTPFRCCVAFVLAYLISLSLFYFGPYKWILVISICMSAFLLKIQCHPKVVLLLFILYSFLVLVLPSQDCKVMSIAYLLNAFLYTHKHYSTNKFLF